MRASNHAVRRVQDRIDNTLSMNQARLLALEMAERGHQPNAGDFDRFGVRPVPWQRYLAAFGYLLVIEQGEDVILTVLEPSKLKAGFVRPTLFALRGLSVRDALARWNQS